MSLAAWVSLMGAALAAALVAGGCGDEGLAGTGGHGAGGTTTSSTSSSSSSSSTTSSTGTSTVFEASGFSCSGATPSLSADVVPITSANCSNSQCHLAMASGSGVRDQLVNRVAEECNDLRLMIKPGDPEHSYAIHKLTNHNLCFPATTMPLNSKMLSTAEIQTIYDWICQGAPDN